MATALIIKFKITCLTSGKSWYAEIITRPHIDCINLMIRELLDKFFEDSNTILPDENIIRSSLVASMCSIHETPDTAYGTYWILVI